MSVILADVSALLAPNLNYEERCADQALITHYLMPSSNKGQYFWFGFVNCMWAVWQRIAPCEPSSTENERT